MNKHIAVLLICLLTIPLFGKAQFTTEWDKVFGGMGNEQADVLFETNDNGLILAGRTSSKGNGQYDGWIIKTNARGVKQWEKTYGGMDEDVITAAAELNNGNFIFAGYTRSKGKGSYDLWMFITNSEGNLIREEVFGDEKWDLGYALSVSEDGNIYIVGTTETPENSFDIWVLKLNPSGKLLWEKTYGSSGRDKAFAVFAAHNEIVIGGYRQALKHPRDFYILCIEPDGKIKWDTYFRQKTHSNIRSIIPAFGGGYFISGYTSSKTGAKNVALAQIDKDGRKQWEKSYGSINDDMIFDAIQLNNNRYAVCGYSASKGEGSKDSYLLITDDYGNSIAEHTFGGIHDEKSYCIIQTYDNGLVICGYTASERSVANDLKVIKLREKHLYNRPPQIKWLSATEFDKKQVKVRASISSNVQVSVNQGNFAQISAGNNTALSNNESIYEFSLNLQPGKNLVQLVATNAAGTTRKQIEVYYRAPIKPPVVEWVYPNHEITTQQRTMRIKAKVFSQEEPKVLVAKNENSEFIRVNAVPRKKEGEYLYDFVINLIRGENNIQLKATNRAGNDVKSMMIKAL